MLHLTRHILRVPNIADSLAFYRDKLGMTAAPLNDSTSRWLVRFAHPSERRDACLELWPSASPDARYTPSGRDAYWKFALTLHDVDEATRRLREAGVEVSNPHQVPDVAYLCHLADPANYIIELVQHDFAANFRPRPADSHPLGSPPVLGLSTLRIQDPEASLAFYQDVLGMRLLSRQKVSMAGFTLYFLACTDDDPPSEDVDALENREWLWRRPFTSVELQHRWRDPVSSYRHDDADAPVGFWGLGFDTDDLQGVCERIEGAGCDVTRSHDDVLQTETATLVDPDGFRLRIEAR